ncbi:MAG: hypothetical protein MMC33_010902 [Icmadophila ericetorum]|nr:hypothetical protein [Icmadophila ericetorum]
MFINKKCDCTNVPPDYIEALVTGPRTLEDAMELVGKCLKLDLAEDTVFCKKHKEALFHQVALTGKRCKAAIDRKKEGGLHDDETVEILHTRMITPAAKPLVKEDMEEDENADSDSSELSESTVLIENSLGGFHYGLLEEDI